MAKASLRVGNVVFGSGQQASEPLDPESPFRILILGDFRAQGRASSQAPLAERKPIAVDRDNFADVMAKLKPQVRVALSPQESVTIGFQDLDDFEPEPLFQKLDAFASLLALRKRLQNPKTFGEAKEEIKKWGLPSPPEAQAAPSRPAPPVAQDDLLREMLGEAPRPASAPGAEPSVTSSLSDWQRFIRDIAAPYVVDKLDPQLADYEKVVDESISARMRTILHDPSFQAVEAIWRGLFFLLKNLETNSQLKLYVMDVSQQELASDLNAGDLAKTGLYHHLVEKTLGTVGGEPWAVVVGHYQFDSTQPDVEVLAALAKIAARANVCVLAGAQSTVLGCSSFAQNTEHAKWSIDPSQDELWEQLRQMPQAKHLGLLLPRFLLRLPYSKDTCSMESFAFEELPDGKVHKSYLWGNSALVGAVFLGQSFTLKGWDLRPGNVRQMAGLPVHIYQEPDGRCAMPSAEVVFRHATIEKILERGLMPVVCTAKDDSVVISRFQSVASDAAPLAGPWS